MAEERQILLEIEVDKKGAQNALEENAELLELNKAELTNLNKAYKNGEIDVAEYAKAKLQLTQENKRLGSENRNLIKTLETEENSLNALRQSLSRLTAERNNTNQQTAEGAERFKQLQSAILDTTNAIKEQEEAGGDFRRSVGNYQTALEGSILDTEVFGTSLNGVGDKLKSLANPLTATVAVVGALGAAYLRTGRGAQDLARATDRLDSALDDFSNQVADLTGATEEGGFLDAALRNIQTKLFGIASTVRSDVIVAIKEQIREFELLRLASDRTAKEQLDNAERLRQVRDEERNSLEERIAANEQLKQVIDEREKERIATQEQQIKNLNVLLKIDEGNLELQKQLAEAEFELADIREESQGFRSEALANELALFREVEEEKLALRTAQINEELILVEAGTRRELELKEQLIDEQLALQLESVGENQAKQNVLIQEALNARLQIYKDFQDNLREVQRINNEEQVEGVVKVSREILKVDNSLVEERIKNTERQIEAERLKNDIILNSVANLSGSLSSLFEQNTAAYKATASIEAAISTYLAINKTLASLPFPANVISSAAIGIQGFANVAKINGLFGGGGGGASAGQTQTATPRITRTQLSGSFDRNQLTSDANNAQADRQNVNDAISNMPAPVVSVTDINKTQKRKQQVKVSGSL